jgi:hypothetical protein
VGRPNMTKKLMISSEDTLWALLVTEENMVYFFRTEEDAKSKGRYQFKLDYSDAGFFNTFLTSPGTPVPCACIDLRPYKISGYELPKP